jgi:hypothetical protein
MLEEDKEHMPQHTFWSSSEVAERWQQDVERRRLDFAEATQCMLEAAGLGVLATWYIRSEKSGKASILMALVHHISG